MLFAGNTLNSYIFSVFISISRFYWMSKISLQADQRITSHHAKMACRTSLSVFVHVCENFSFLLSKIKKQNLPLIFPLYCISHSIRGAHVHNLVWLLPHFFHAQTVTRRRACINIHRRFLDQYKTVLCTPCCILIFSLNKISRNSLQDKWNCFNSFFFMPIS